jgi:hypothetical protein
MITTLRALKTNTLSIEDVLLMARCIKIECCGNVWLLKNTQKKELQMLK